MQLTATTILVAFAGVFLICFMKGAFGGGFSIIGIPLLSEVMDPVTAGGLLAPLFVAMDLYALRYFKRSTWSGPDLLLLLPGLVTGIGLGYLLFRLLDHRAIAIVMAVTTLCFVGLWLARGLRSRHARARRRRQSRPALRLASRQWWRIPADRRLRCISCRLGSARTFMLEPPACSLPSGMRPRCCLGCYWSARQRIYGC
jgi:uncharacterized membrane protein YfcA